jgi:hypothetical protein
MDNRSAVSPLGDTLALLAQPAALLAGFALIGAQLSRSYVMAMVIERARMTTNYGLVGIAAMGVGIVAFAVFAVVHFMLSRKLGGPEDSEGEPGIGNWVALMFLYFIFSQLVSFITPLMLTTSGLGVTSYPLIMGGISFVERLVFFPVMVSLAALAHDGEGCTFGDIWSFLTSSGLGWFGGYVLLSIAVTLAPLGLMAALGPHAGSAAGSGMLVSSLVFAAGQLLSIVFAIATYRAARANKDGGGLVLF